MLGLGWTSDGTANSSVWILVRRLLGIRSIGRLKRRLSCRIQGCEDGNLLERSYSMSNVGCWIL